VNLTAPARTLREATRWAVVLVLLLHGSLHLLGAAKGLGWAEVPALREPIGPALGAAWLASAVLLLVVAVLLALRVRWWWVAGAVALVVSQALVVSSWADAWAGTVANLVLLLAVVHGAAAEGPWSLRAEYRRRSAATLPPRGPEPAGGVLTEADLAGLPAPVAAYVRQSGAVGRPRVDGFRARFHGRIRAAEDEPWMPFTAQQTSRYGEHTTRLFLIDATMKGLPVDVLHVFGDGTATMRVRLGSLATMAEGHGPEMDRAETVTVFNDLCLLLPAALVDAPVRWEVLDPYRVRGHYTLHGQTVAADLLFDDRHRLVDFVSDDRSRSSQDGRQFTPQRWSTPFTDYRTLDGRSVGTLGEARWHPGGPDAEPEVGAGTPESFAYLEIVVDALTCEPVAVTGPATRDAPPAPPAARDPRADPDR
jgi:hypothetical protein